MTGRALSPAIALFGFLAAGCGDEEPEAATAGSTGSDAGIHVIPPPAPPQMNSWTCARGWLPETMLEGTELEYSICVPPPLPEDCADGTMPLLGESACQPIGDPCPAGDWPEGLPASASVVYVQAGATGGDGTSTGAPLGSIGAAVVAASSGAIVAIAKGTYAETVSLSKPITLWGACVAAVTVQGPPGELADATIEVSPPGGAIRNVTLTGQRSGILVYGGAALEGAGIRVAAATGVGVIASGGSLALDGLAITDTQPLPDGTFGRALAVQSGVHATIEHALLDHNRDAGAVADGAGTDLTLTDVIVRDTQSQESDKQFGGGLGVQFGAHATVERALFDRNRERCLLATDPGSSLTLTDVVVKDTQSKEDEQTNGQGLTVLLAAHATVERALFDRNRALGIFASDPDTSITLADVVVKDTQSLESDEQYGRGLGVELGARAAIERTLFDHNREVGVFAGGAGTHVELTDTVVKDTQSQQSDKRLGRGLQVQSGARATTLRALFDHNRDHGVVAYDVGTDVSLTDVVVEATQPKDSNGEYGVGVAVTLGAVLQISSSRISKNRVAGLLAESGGQLGVTSSEIGATEAGSFTLLGPDGTVFDGPHYDDIGDGIVVLGGSSAVLTDVRVAECVRAGILFSDSSGSLAFVTSTTNRYGLALQGSPQPTYDLATCDFGGNADLAIVTNGNLPVPNAPLDVPAGP